MLPSSGSSSLYIDVVAIKFELFRDDLTILLPMNDVMSTLGECLLDQLWISPGTLFMNAKQSIWAYLTHCRNSVPRVLAYLRVYP